MKKKSVILPVIDNIESMRHVHIVSAFFIGLLIKEKLYPELTVCGQKCNDYKFSYIWKGIDMSFSEERINIKILDDGLSFENMMKKVIGLDNWLDVRVETYCEKREVIIYI